MIVPESPAGMSVKTFIASMMQTVVSARTTDPTLTNGGASGELAEYSAKNGRTPWEAAAFEALGASLS